VCRLSFDCGRAVLEQRCSKVVLARRDNRFEGTVEDKDVSVFVVVTEDAADVSLIKSLLSSEGDVRALVICMAASIDDDDGVGEGMCR
jgi:hypothetical protein